MQIATIRKITWAKWRRYLVVNPYQDQKLSGKEFYRTFEHNTPDEELVWHRDHEHRRVTIVRGRGWYLQMDNTLPVELKETREYTIPKDTYHRILKSPGAEDLVLKIREI